MTTSWLSVAGFVLSIIANVWVVGLMFVRWPRVSVETRRYMSCNLRRLGPRTANYDLTIGLP